MNHDFHIFSPDLSHQVPTYQGPRHHQFHPHLVQLLRLRPAQLERRLWQRRQRRVVCGRWRSIGTHLTKRKGGADGADRALRVKFDGENGEFDG